jgi:hypothetical protein
MHFYCPYCSLASIPQLVSFCSLTFSSFPHLRSPTARSLLRTYRCFHGTYRLARAAAQHAAGPNDASKAIRPRTQLAARQPHRLIASLRFMICMRGSVHVSASTDAAGPLDATRAS